LLAGRDTAEWAYNRKDVRPLMKHGPAAVFDSRPGDAANSFLAQRYWTRISLGARTSVSRLEIANAMQSATLSVWKLTVYDNESKHSTPVVRPALDPLRWHTEADFDGVVVLRNTRALPRAWLVADAQAVDGEEALARIRGAGNQLFDPRRTALVEISVSELPRLPGGDLTAGSSARITSYEPSRLTIETDAPTATMLVTSEIFYPGWEATVDGQRTRILLTDYLLRGVALPAGHHRIEMRYRAPAARNGAVISACTLLVLAGLTILAQRDAVRARKVRHE
jgi:hypothetical protein